MNLGFFETLKLIHPLIHAHKQLYYIESFKNLSINCLFLPYRAKTVALVNVYEIGPVSNVE